MNEHDIILVQELTQSYQQQFIWYKELRDLVRKILSRLILSRGNMSELLAGLEKKQKLLESIEAERRRTSEYIVQWQNCKAHIETNDEIKIFDDVLQKTGLAIKEFLDEEEMLKRYLEGIIKKDSLLRNEAAI
jgi:hypothetical protein